ncbi:DUF6458 family protein [Propionibacteriaceae bacterium Y1685]|uniref:DUF6458 family protein n=1 Tax=Microlunatus sp. Y1700 TaxID=3418487 RepID=UPI003B7BC825
MMGIGLGIVLLAIGLIFGLGVIDMPSAVDNVVDSSTLGWILAGLGVLAIILALVMNAQRSRTRTTHVMDDRRVVDDRREPPAV